MLSATIAYKQFNGEIEEVLSSTGLKKKTSNVFLIFSENQRQIGETTINSDERKMTITFSGNLNFKEYETIHNLIVLLLERTNGEVDDSNSLLGYLENGEKAFIVGNWEKWTLFLNEAKYKTLEGQKVKVLNSANQELGEGLLVDYKFESTEQKPFVIIECTIITSFGEKTFTDQKLYVEPTNLW